MAQIERTNVKRRTTNKKPETTAVAPTGGTIVGDAPGRPRRMVGVLFGPPKTAKTTAACSGKNVLLVSFDPDGDATRTLQGRDDVLVVRPRDQKALDELVRALHTTDRGRFDWVVVDSLTFLFLMLGGKDITDAWKSNKDFRREYGKAGAAVQQFVHDLVLIEGQNIVFTAHLEKENDEDDDPLAVNMDQELGENEVKVAVTPMVWRILGPAVSFIGRTYRGRKTAQVEEDGKKRLIQKEGFFVSFNDGERSPAGSRLNMEGQYEITLDWLDTLASELIEGGS